MGCACHIDLHASTPWTKLLAAARILMDGGQGARSGEILQHLKAARVAAQAAASDIQSWKEGDDDSACWPTSAYILVPEPEVQRLRARLRAPVDSQPTSSGTAVTATSDEDTGNDTHHRWPDPWKTSVFLPWNVSNPRATRAEREHADPADTDFMSSRRSSALRLCDSRPSFMKRS